MAMNLLSVVFCALNAQVSGGQKGVSGANADVVDVAFEAPVSSLAEAAASYDSSTVLRDMATELQEHTQRLNAQISDVVYAQRSLRAKLMRYQ